VTKFGIVLLLDALGMRMSTTADSYGYALADDRQIDGWLRSIPGQGIAQ
jgi:hypothetical protein